MLDKFSPPSDIRPFGIPPSDIPPSDIPPSGMYSINYVQIVFGYYFANNVGGATISTNFNKTYPRTISVQYLRILLSSFGEEDF